MAPATTQRRAASVGKEAVSFRAILSCQCARYPGLQLPDLYKWLVQACLGSEHAVGDERTVQAWLDREIASLGEGPAEPLVDVISADNRVARIHLRPYLAAGLAPALLLEGFVRTARQFQGSPAQLRRYSRWTAEAAAAGSLPFSAPETEAYLAEMEAAGFPAVHHSPAYEALYRPAYRVVARDCLPAPLRMLWPGPESPTG